MKRLILGITFLVFGIGLMWTGTPSASVLAGPQPPGDLFLSPNQAVYHVGDEVLWGSICHTGWSCTKTVTSGLNPRAPWLIDTSTPGEYQYILIGIRNADGAVQTTTRDFTVEINHLCGDVHPNGQGNGVVNVLDALRVLKIANGLIIPNDLERVIGDVHPENANGPNGDGDIDILDALRVLKAAVGLIDLPPWPEGCGG